MPQRGIAAADFVQPSLAPTVDQQQRAGGEGDGQHNARAGEATQSKSEFVEAAAAGDGKRNHAAEGNQAPDQLLIAWSPKRNFEQAEADNNFAPQTQAREANFRSPARGQVSGDRLCAVGHIQNSSANRM